MSRTKRIIAVVGATGKQGGSVARAILGDVAGDFALRVLTRKPSGDRAQALARLGAEVVYANADDLASLKGAFAGAYGAYCMTDFWGGQGDPERERVQGSTMAEAARCMGVQHVIWSTLEDTRRYIPLADSRMPTLLGKYKVPHYDGKGAADEAFRSLGVPTTFFLTSFYWENLLHFPGMGPRKNPGGEIVFAMPMADKKLPGIAIDDIGLCALGVFGQACSAGQTVGVAGEHPTCEQMAASMTKVLGRNVRYTEIDPVVFRTSDFPGAPELSNMLQFKRDFQDIFCGARSVERSRQLNPALQTFDQWLARHASEFIL
jgi:uncharacterized protein YbjT (DUF2867 family)